MAKPNLPDINTLIQAGIDPKTGLPVKMGNVKNGIWRKEAILSALAVLDEQNAVNRYVWYNLPTSITSQELERLLYYKGQLCFFYYPVLDKFYFMPYALDGNIDFYGRYNSVHPIPIASGVEDEKSTRYTSQYAFLSTLKLQCIYDVPDTEQYIDIYKSCVLLHDYTKALSQTIIPRSLIQQPILNIMSDMIPFARTALLNSTGVQGMRVNSQDEASNVKQASLAIDDAALNGDKYVAIVGGIEFQELTNGQIFKAEEFLMTMQSLDNFRLSLYGLDNGGLFQKKSHMLEAEQVMNSGKCSAALQDGLAIRQNFCDIVNSIWGLGISCEIADSAIQLDSDFDGDTSDDVDQSGALEGGQEPLNDETV